MIILFTPEQKHPQEMEIIHALLEAGLERLHLRKPGADIVEYKTYLNSIPKEYLNKVYIHQYHTLKDEFPAIQLHLRNQDAALTHFNVKTTGAHTLEEALEKLKDFDQVYLSPVFPSISKKAYHSSHNLAIQHLNLRTRERIIALGGITKNNILQAKEMGYQHFAVLGSVWQAKNPLEYFKDLHGKA